MLRLHAELNFRTPCRDNTQEIHAELSVEIHAELGGKKVHIELI